MRLLRASLMTALLIAPVLADKGGVPHNKDRDEQNRDQQQGRPAARVVVTFGQRDREVINGYYGNHSNLPPGLAKRNGNLPPGLQKQMQRNGHLPPGLENRFTPFPVDVERRLPPIPRGCGCVRGLLDGQAVIYDPKTRIILDVLDIVQNLRR
jgi:hypothetical protein